MSGQQWGAAIGFVVGAFFGAPQLGAAIGGMIGGWIDPTKVEGPHIGDQATQSSQEGQPIPWIVGTCGWIEGNIVDKSEVREVKKKDDGKGSGVETVTFEAHQDYQIMICESSTVRNSLMVGVLIVQVDGKIVYDMRPESNFGADNAKFLENHTFYDGNDAQLPDPTMEALPHNGVGNTPYYRNVFTMVARDVNLSQYGERIPVYRFVMVGEGDNVTTEVTRYVPAEYGRFGNVPLPLLDPEDHYQYQVFWTDESAGGLTSPVFSTQQECNEWFLDQTGMEAPGNYVGYSANTLGTAGQYNTGQDGSGNFVTSSAFEEQIDVTNIKSLVLLYQWHQPASWNDKVGESACDVAEEEVWQGLKNGSIVKSIPSLLPPTDLLVFDNCSGDFWACGYYPYCINVIRKSAPPSPVAGDPCLLGEPTLLPDAPGFVINCAGEITPTPTYEEQSGDFFALQEEAFTSVSNVLFYTQYEVGPVILETDPIGTQAYWEAAYAQAVANGEMEAGKTYPDDYPVQIESAFLETVSTTSMEEGPVPLADVITRIVLRGGLSSDDIDVTEMDQDVLGYMITQNYIGTDCIRPLMTAFVSYASEYDAKIRFHKHGEAATLAIDSQDIIQGTEESDNNIREQQVEFPKTYSITYIDATQNYTARPQVDRRTSSDIRAIGEMQTQVPVVLPPNYARQLANIGMKVNWARAMGSREFSVPYAGYDVYLEMVAGKPFGMDSQRRIASEISLEDGEIKLKGLYDRQSAYTSDITATPALPPTPPPSNIGGVTVMAVMNIGVIRDQDDTLGIYIAVAGLLSGWPGALLQWKLDTESDWTTAIASMTQSSTMGYLTADLPLAPAEGDDVTNTLSVSVRGGELNSITRQQYLNEGNPFAIISNETTGECEIGQFQTSDETAPGEYNLSILTRGGLNTDPAAHPQGARFVYLDSVYFLPVPIAWLGRTINFRPVTFGTIPDNNASYSLLFDPAVSQTEWQPAYLTGRYGVGSSFQLSVTPRHRLGNDVTPVASANFTGYRWTATDGVVTQTADTVDPAYTFDLSAFTGTITFSVSELNRITGPGPSTSITL